jgi:acetyl esterase/lipase
MNTTTAPSTTAAFPPVIELSPADAREVLRQVQASVPVELPLAQIDDRVIPGGPTGEVSIRIVRPANTTGVLPVVLHSHGGGWIPGDKDIHERLGCELADQAQAVVVFVRYTPAPEAHYPTQNEQVYTALHWAVASAAQISAGPTRVVLIGSVGGNMTAALTLMAKQHGGPQIAAQLLFYLVTDACARRLSRAGVPVTQVRYGGTIHTVLLNPITHTVDGMPVCQDQVSCARENLVAADAIMSAAKAQGRERTIAARRKLSTQ